MIRKEKYFPGDGIDIFNLKVVPWATQFDHFSIFLGNGFNNRFGSFNTFAAVGSVSVFTTKSNDPFKEWISFYESNKDWMIGYLNYDLKNKLNELNSNNTDRLDAPEIYFFIPETLIFLQEDGLMICSVDDPNDIYKEITDLKPAVSKNKEIIIECDTSHEEYIEKVLAIQDQIREGDFYELNYCIEYYTTIKSPDLLSIYQRLNSISPMPFSVFQKLDKHYILSASPERFLKKTGKQLIAQPMKGTMKRSPDPAIDEKLKSLLKNSEKEIAENMMIIDLTRNDLTKNAVTGSISVPALFEIHSFSHIHQMVSTITATLDVGKHFIDAIKDAFPMGSMTGAPKICVMEAIEKYENSRRSMFSGAAGYISPEGDFDFNVLIRSIFYSYTTKFLKFNVGSAITIDSKAEDEYLESQLKAKALMKALYQIR